jgi:hypothetical protein
MVLVVVGAAAVYLVISRLDSIVEAAIEHYGSEATGARVTVQSVELSLRSGEGNIRGVVVGNPKGFKGPSAFELGLIRVALDPETVTSDPLVVREIRIEGPKASYEWGPRGSNIEAIQRNVDAFVARYAGGAKPGAKSSQPSEPDGAEQRFIVESLSVTGGSVNARASDAPDAVVEAKLRDLKATNLGAKKGGATGAEITGEILDVLIADVTRTVAKMGVDRLKREAAKALDDQAEAALGAAAKKLLGD